MIIGNIKNQLRLLYSDTTTIKHLEYVKAREYMESYIEGGKAVSEDRTNMSSIVVYRNTVYNSRNDGIHVNNNIHKCENARIGKDINLRQGNGSGGIPLSKGGVNLVDV